jgi:hypothetical protein
MTKYLISFPASAMKHFSSEELKAASVASHAVVQEAKDAGVWVFGGGLNAQVPTLLVSGNGTATDGTYPQTKEFDGGFTVLEVPTKEEAIGWAGKIAKACRCPQELREFYYNPAS